MTTTPLPASRRERLLRLRYLRLRKEQLRREALRRRANTDFLSYVQHTKPDFKVNWHHRLIASALQSWVEGKITRLIIEAPPRHGKSELSVRRLVPWLLGKNPSAEVLISSHNDKLAGALCTDTQDVVITPEHQDIFPSSTMWQAGTKTRKGWRRAKATQKEYRLVNQKGRVLAAGINAGINGRGFTHGIIDDYHKDWAEAQSEEARNKIRKWFDSTFLARQSPGASVLVMCTRWHSDDLIGGLVADDDTGIGHGWLRITLPAQMTHDNIDSKHPDDPRKIGEYLDELRFKPKHYEQFQRDPTVWAAPWQQRPAKGKGLIFDSAWFRFFEILPDLNHYDVFVSIDANFKRSATSANGCIQVWARHHERVEFLLLDERAGKWTYVDLEDECKLVQADWPEASSWLVEEAANGYALISRMQGEIPGIVPIVPKGSKEQRAQAIAPLYKAGQVLYPSEGIVIRGRPAYQWIGAHQKEITGFPFGKRKDRVDACSQALAYGEDESTKAILIGRADDDEFDDYSDQDLTGYPPWV